jgi:hypothetical membrane protein
MKFTGLLDILFFGLMVLYLMIRSRSFDLKKHTISCLATESRIGSLFNVSLGIFALGQVLFAIEVCRYFSINSGIAPISMFLIGGIFLLLASIFSMKNSPRLHSLTATLCAVFVSLGVIILSMDVFRKNLILGIVMIGATLLVPCGYWFRKRLEGGFWELFFCGAIAIWNITLSIPLIYK